MFSIFIEELALYFSMKVSLTFTSFSTCSVPLVFDWFVSEFVISLGLLDITDTKGFDIAAKIFLEQKDRDKLISTLDTIKSNPIVHETRDLVHTIGSEVINYINAHFNGVLDRFKDYLKEKLGEASYNAFMSRFTSNADSFSIVDIEGIKDYFDEFIAEHTDVMEELSAYIEEHPTNESTPDYELAKQLSEYYKTYVHGKVKQMEA